MAAAQQDPEGEKGGAQPIQLSYASAKTLKSEISNPLAVIALVCSLIFLLMIIPVMATEPYLVTLILMALLPPAAIALGIAGHRKSRRAGGSARGFALGAIVLGAIELVFVALLALPQKSASTERANRIKCAINLRQIGQGLWLYASENQGQYPPSLDLLITQVDMAPECFICPSSNDDLPGGATVQDQVWAFRTKPGHCSYVYTASQLTDAASSRHVLAYEHVHHHLNEGINVLYGDGHVDWLPKPEADWLISELAAGHNPPRPRTAEEAGSGT